MKKSILYSAVALVLVAAALFFAIFGTNGSAYNYAKKKVEKNLSGLVYTGFDLSGPQLATVEEKDIVAKLAAMVAGAASKTTSDENPTGYDIVRLNYWGTYEKEDGSVVTFTESKLMNPASPVQVQLQSDTDLAKIFGEKLNNNTFCTHVEKAYGNIRGAYQMINREFARQLSDRYEYINREDDTGSEGLRRAKLSYHPHRLVIKYSAIYKG